MGNFAENLNLGNRFRPPLSKAENGRYYFVSWVSGKSLGVRSAYFGYGVFNTELGSDINRALNPQEV